MSRIHDALRRAQAERGAAGPLQERPTGPRVQAPRRHVEPLPSESSQTFPDRDLPQVRFSPGAGAVLARAFDPIERCVSMERGLVPEPGAASARTVLVTGSYPATGAAGPALALAVALAEKTRCRTLLVDACAGGRELSELFGAHPTSPGFWDGVVEGGEVSRGIRRTDLARLYFLPCGGWSEIAQVALRDGEAAQRLRLLAGHVPFVVVHAGGLDEALGAALAPLVDAVLPAEKLLGLATVANPWEAPLHSARI